MLHAYWGLICDLSHKTLLLHRFECHIIKNILRWCFTAQKSASFFNCPLHSAIIFYPISNTYWMFLSIIENGNPQGKFHFIRETFFEGGLCTGGVGLYLPNVARVVIKTLWRNEDENNRNSIFTLFRSVLWPKRAKLSHFSIAQCSESSYSRLSLFLPQEYCIAWSG